MNPLLLLIHTKEGEEAVVQVTRAYFSHDEVEVWPVDQADGTYKITWSREIVSKVVLKDANGKTLYQGRYG